MKEKLKKEWKEFCVLVRTVPAWAFAMFVAAVMAMNLLANKSIDTGLDFLALDCGITVSWFAFAAMDVITKRFGAKAATELSVAAMIINLLLCLLFFISSVIPGTWGESYVEGSERVINSALDKTFGGTWYVILGSSVAFFISSVINNALNYCIGKAFKGNPDGMAAFALRSYVSTAAGQFADNMIFALIVSHTFFGWSILQCVTCSITGMVAELICEVIFSPAAYAISRRWQKTGVGAEYLNLTNKESDKEKNL